MIAINCVKERELGAKSCRQRIKYTLPGIKPRETEVEPVEKLNTILIILIVTDTKIVEILMIKIDDRIYVEFIRLLRSKLKATLWSEPTRK